MVFMAVPSQQVVNLRTSAGFPFLHAILPLFQNLMNFAGRVIQVTENTNLRWAGLDARGKLATVKPARTEITLLHDAQILTEKACIIRTGNHAVAAADAFGRVDRHNAVGTFVRSP